MKIILTQNKEDILGGDGLMYVDGRLNIESIKTQIIKRNNSMLKNFPHKIADGFYFINFRGLKRNSKIYSL